MSIAREKRHNAHVLVVEVTDPWGGCYHGDASEGDGDDAPCEQDLGRVFCDVMLEISHNSEDEPCDTRGSRSGVDAADVLQKSGPPDPEPERRPLEAISSKLQC